MAGIALTSLFSQLNQWPGTLFEADSNTTVLTQTAKQFSFRYASTGVDFPDYRVVVTGTGFAFDSGGAYDGVMSSVRIFNAAGQLVLSFANLAPNTLASDFSQFYANVFGSSSGEGPGPDGFVAMSHLMSHNDVITGTAGDDRQSLAGMDVGNDVYNLLAGDDYVNGGIGDDTINGGAGTDMLSFWNTAWNEGVTAWRGIAVDVVAGTVLDPWGGTDSIISVEEFEGSRFSDSFAGGASRNWFAGLRGRDTIDGGDNSFDAFGNATNDLDDAVSYQSDYWSGGSRGIVANLETSFVNGSIRGTIRDGFGNLDTVIDIENVEGTRFNDVFVGSRVDNVFAGGEGVDSYRGAGGYDAIDFDTWFGDVQPGGIRVDLSLAVGQIIDDGFGNTETATGIEDIGAGSGNDWIKGSAGFNFISGGLGADTMAGGAGSDTFLWYDPGEFNQGDRITDFTAAGAAADHLAFEVASFAGMTGTLVLVNGPAATQAVGTFIFRNANDTLYWDPDGTGAAAAQLVAVLTNVSALSAANFDLWT